jgi:hypothetical protein
MPPDPDYEVGYGKPPRHTRFKKGQSGNPRGRAKRGGGANLAAVVSEILDEMLTLNENGRRRKIPKRTALAKQIVNGALQGDARAIQSLLRVITHGEHNGELGPPILNVIRRGADAKP